MYNHLECDVNRPPADALIDLISEEVLGYCTVGQVESLNILSYALEMAEGRWAFDEDGVAGGAHDGYPTVRVWMAHQETDEELQVSFDEGGRISVQNHMWGEEEHRWVVLETWEEVEGLLWVAWEEMFGY